MQRRVVGAVASKCYHKFSTQCSSERILKICKLRIDKVIDISLVYQFFGTQFFWSFFGLSLWLIGTVRAETERDQPGLGTSIPRPGRINCFRITGVHALRLISRTGKRVDGVLYNL